MKKTIVVAAFMAVSVFFTDCRKDNLSDQVANHKTSQPSNALEEEDFYKNSNNPYDEIGQIHNEGLDYVYQSYPNWSGAPVDEVLFDESVAYGVSLGHTQGDLQTGLANTVTTLDQYMENNNDEFDLAINNMIQDWSGSQNAKNYMSALFNEVLNYTDVGNIQPLITTLKGIEDNVAGDAGLSGAEKESLFKAASVLRHSLYYWDTNSLTNWPNGDPPVAIFKKIRDWIKNHQHEIKVACADAAIFILEPTPWGAVAAVLTSISVS